MENLDLVNDFDWNMISDSEQFYFDYEPKYKIDEDPFKEAFNWSDKIKKLKENYVHEDFDKMIRFLRKVHPELEVTDKHKKYGNVAIELRVIDREFEDKKGAVTYHSNHMFWLLGRNLILNNTYTLLYS